MKTNKAGVGGGGDGHEGVNWEFLLIIRAEQAAENPTRESSPLHLSLKLFNQWLPLKYEDCGGGGADKSHKLPENGIGGAGLQIPSSHLRGIGG